MSAGAAASRRGLRERRGTRVATRARVYLLVASLLTLAVALLLFVVGWSTYIVRQRTNELALQTQAIARGMEASAETLGSQEPPTSDSLQGQLFSLRARLIRAALYVTTDTGAIVLSSRPSSLEVLPLETLREGDDGVRTGESTTQGGARLLIVAAPAELGYGDWVVAAQPTREVRAIQMGWLAVGGVSLLLAAAVSWVAGGFLARRLTTPLVRLRDAAEAVSAGAWGAQVAEEGDDEVVSLARSFNRMSARVADTYTAQKAFVGDISHELRTPITSIRGFSEAILDGTVTDEEQVKRSARIIHDEALRMSSIADTLLALAQLESGALEVVREPVDLVAFGVALRGRFAGSARDAGLTLEIALPSQPAPLGDFDRLLQAASALLSNAIAYTPPGGTVRVGSPAARGDRWRLAVDDSGAGVPEDRREEVFGRFTRIEQTPANPAAGVADSGSGLGLAICQRLVGLMDGGVWVENSNLGGARFVIELPMAPSSHEGA